MPFMIGFEPILIRMLLQSVRDKLAFPFVRDKLSLCFSSSLMAESESNPNPTATDHEEEKGDGGHILFPSRHEHELCLFEGLPAYRCSGCKEYGANIGYKCKDSHSSSCKNFTLHEACANLPDECQHRSRKLYKFRPKTLLSHHCDACRDVLKGFVFEAERPDHYLERLHPLCMVLPEKLNYGGHKHPQLKLVPGDDEYCCSECRKNNTAGGWRYRCEEVTCQISLDLSCAKINFYELSESGITRIAPMSRSRKFRSSGKWIASVVTGAVVSGATGAVVSGAMGALVGGVPGAVVGGVMGAVVSGAVLGDIIS